MNETYVSIKTKGTIFILLIKRGKKKHSLRPRFQPFCWRSPLKTTDPPLAAGIVLSQWTLGSTSTTWDATRETRLYTFLLIYIVAWSSVVCSHTMFTNARRISAVTREIFSVPSHFPFFTFHTLYSPFLTYIYSSIYINR